MNPDIGDSSVIYLVKCIPKIEVSFHAYMQAEIHLQ